MKKLLWIGDAGVPSGFAVATHGILRHLHEAFDVTVLGMNYRGDPHMYPYPIYAAAPGGDTFGVGRLIWMCDVVKPDVIVLQNDGWNISMYLRRLRAKLPNGEYMFPDYAAIPVVAAVAVDGKNFQGKWLNGVAMAIFWTRFALNEARAGGYQGLAEVIPLGVDTDIYHPMDKYEARLRRGLPREFDETFVVGNVNRNQPRKRWDLTVKYFAEWVKSYDVRDALLYMHSAPTGDDACDVVQLARYYGVVDRLAHIEPQIWYGVSEEQMCDTYNCFDVLISTTQGEGMGLPALEAMACGVPCILPNWSAYGDWARDAALLVACSSTAVGMNNNVIGGVPDEADFIRALDAMYRKPVVRETFQRSALTLVQRPQFRWEHISAAWSEVLAGVLEPAQPLAASRSRPEAGPSLATERPEECATGKPGEPREAPAAPGVRA
jgi:D-inositol-3-phosphate glycosyltransferase